MLTLDVGGFSKRLVGTTDIFPWVVAVVLGVMTDATGVGGLDPLMVTCGLDRSFVGGPDDPADLAFDSISSRPSLNSLE